MKAARHRVMLVALAALTAFSGQIAASDRPLSLEQAIDMALRNSEAIVIRREALAAAEAATDGARGVYDPLLEAAGSWHRSRPPVNSAFSGAPSGELAPTFEGTQAGLNVRQYLPTGGAVALRAGASRETSDGAFTLLSPAYGTQVGLELRQPLLRDRAIDPARLGIQVADAGRTGADADLRGTVNDNIALVERSYWRLVAVLREVEVRKEAIRLAQEQLEQTEIRVQSGTVPKTDVAQPRAEIERRRGELLAATEEVSRSENLLKLLILSDKDGDLWFDRIVPTEPMEAGPGPVDVASAVEEAFAARPEVAAAEALVDQRKAESRFADTATQPALDAVVSYDWLGLSGFENPDGAPLPGVPAPVPPEIEGGLGRSWGTLGEGRFNDARVGLFFGIPLGNRAARAAAAGARSAQLQAEAELSRVRKLVRVEVMDAAARLQTTAQRIETARAALNAAEVQLFAEKERFDVGLSTNFLVLTRQNDLSEARLVEISSLVDYRTAASEMERAKGALVTGHALEPAGSEGAPR